MQRRLINLNCRDKEYKFNMTDLSEEDWNNFAHSVVLAKGERVKDLALNVLRLLIQKLEI